MSLQSLRECLRVCVCWQSEVLRTVDLLICHPQRNQQQEDYTPVQRQQQLRGSMTPSTILKTHFPVWVIRVKSLLNWDEDNYHRKENKMHSSLSRGFLVLIRQESLETTGKWGGVVRKLPMSESNLDFPHIKVSSCNMSEPVRDPPCILRLCPTWHPQLSQLSEESILSRMDCG